MIIWGKTYGPIYDLHLPTNLQSTALSHRITSPCSSRKGYNKDQRPCIPLTYNEPASTIETLSIRFFMGNGKPQTAGYAFAFSHCRDFKL